MCSFFQVVSTKSSRSGFSWHVSNVDAFCTESIRFGLVNARARCPSMTKIGLMGILFTSSLSWAARGELFDPTEINRALWDGPATAKQEMARKLDLRNNFPGVQPVSYCVGNFTLEQNHISLQSGVRDVVFVVYANHDCNYDYIVILEPAGEKLYRHVLTARFRNRPFHREISYPPFVAADESMIMVSGYTFPFGRSLRKETLVYRLEGWILKLVFSGVEKTLPGEPAPPVEDLDSKPLAGDYFFSAKNPISEAFKSKRMMEGRVGRDGHLHMMAEFEWNPDADHFLPVLEVTK